MKSKNTFLGGLLLAIMALFGYQQHTTPSTPVPPVVVDTTTHTTPPPVVTPPPTKPDTVYTPPVVTPPPVVTGGSGINVTGAVIAEDFSNYANTAAWLQRVTRNIAGGTNTDGHPLVTDGRFANLSSIDENVKYNGHHTLKYNQPANTDSSPELWIGVNPALPHVWFEVHIRFTPGWTTIGTGKTYGDGGVLVGSSNAYKLLGWEYDTHVVDGSGRIEITNTTEYQNYWNMSVKNTTQHAGGGGNTSAGQVGTEWTDGLWYTYVVEIDNTQPTAVTRFYIGKNGAKPVLRATCTGTMDKGGLVPLIDEILAGLNYNQVRLPNQNLSLNYGDIVVVDGSKNADPFLVH